METNLYKVYYRNNGHLDSGYIQAGTAEEAVERFNRLYPKHNIVTMTEVSTVDIPLH